MIVPFGLMIGAEVGIIEKKQGSVTFPESEPLMGRMMDKALVAVAEAASQRQYNHRIRFIFSNILKDVF